MVVLAHGYAAAEYDDLALAQMHFDFTAHDGRFVGQVCRTGVGKACDAQRGDYAIRIGAPYLVRLDRLAWIHEFVTRRNDRYSRAPCNGHAGLPGRGQRGDFGRPQEGARCKHPRSPRPVRTPAVDKLTCFWRNTIAQRRMPSRNFDIFHGDNTVTTYRQHGAGHDFDTGIVAFECLGWCARGLQCLNNKSALTFGKRIMARCDPVHHDAVKWRFVTFSTHVNTQNFTRHILQGTVDGPGGFDLLRDERVSLFHADHRFNHSLLSPASSGLDPRSRCRAG